MPPRIREVAAWLKAMEFRMARRGRGDHTIYENPVTDEKAVLDGGPDQQTTDAGLAQAKKALRHGRHAMKTVIVRIDYDPQTTTYGATSEDLPDVTRLATTATR